MKILSPIDHTEELEPLYRAGAGEVYCGYVPAYWTEAFNHALGGELEFYQVGINKRDVRNCNLTSLEDLKLLCEGCRQLGMELFLTVNAAFYPAMAYELLDRYLHDVTAAGVENVIVNDLGMMQWMKERFPSLKLTVSCLTQTTNSYAVNYYRQFAVRRIVFPRHMTIGEITETAAQHPDLEFEYFLLSDKCIYDDGFCRCQHDLGTFCLDSFQKGYYRKGNGDLSQEEIYKLEQNDAAFTTWSNKKQQGYKGNRTFYNLGCSVCSLVECLKYPNINSLKIVGRGKPVEIKCKLVETAEKAIALGESGAGVSDLRLFMRREYPGNTEMCTTNLHCIVKGE